MIPKFSSFDEYADLARSTTHYPLAGRNMVYPALKLAGESGELADKIGKHWRNDCDETMKRYRDYADPPSIDMQERDACCWGMNSKSLSPPLKAEILKELGDVLWYVNAVALELGSTLQEVAEMNIEKITDRRKRNVVCGVGDNR